MPIANAPVPGEQGRGFVLSSFFENRFFVICPETGEGDEMADWLNDEYVLEDCFLMEAELEKPLMGQTEQRLEEFISKSLKGREAEPSERQKAKDKAPLACSIGEGDQVRAEIFVAQDGLAAFIKLHSPESFAKKLTLETVFQALKENQITFGVQERQLSRLLQNPVYGTRILFARGKSPLDGENGRLVLSFDPEKKTGPVKEEEHGGVNFRELGFGNIVRQGQVLGQIIPPERGTPGQTVTGKPTAGKDGKPANPSLGSNTRLSKDGSQILAACDGEAAWRNGKLCVDRTMQVPEVNSSTGNISFLGTVKVAGNVCQGFTVRATGNIIVKGIVENAFLNAGGSITVEGGINSCLGKGVVAEGDVYAKYIENSVVKCHGCIGANEILNSNLISDEMVVAQGAKGCLIGGDCRTMQVRANTIGNSVDVPTRIEIDLPLSVFREREAVDQKKTMLREEKNRLLREQKNMTPEELEENMSSVYRLQWAEQEIARREKKLEKEENDLRKQHRMGVFVKTALHRNVSISIESARLITKEETAMCGVVKDKSEVVIEAIFKF